MVIDVSWENCEDGEAAEEDGAKMAQRNTTKRKSLQKRLT
jgi:hypothetical protein